MVACLSKSDERLVESETVEVAYSLARNENMQLLMALHTERKLRALRDFSSALLSPYFVQDSAPPGGDSRKTRILRLVRGSSAHSFPLSTHGSTRV